MWLVRENHKRKEQQRSGPAHGRIVIKKLTEAWIQRWTKLERPFIAELL